MNVRSLVFTGCGMNCQDEVNAAFTMAGAKSDIHDIRDVLSGKVDMFAYDVVTVVGGFAFGDDLGAGMALADMMQYKMVHTPKGDRPFIELIEEFIKEGKVVLGICNGFQVLVKLGLLPALDERYGEQQVTLMSNDSNKYEDRWITLKLDPDAPCVATKGLTYLTMPVRHGEGKFVVRDKSVKKQLHKQHLAFAQYADSQGNIASSFPDNPNGSSDAIAGITDTTGRVIGMMPHPEANLLFVHHPRWTRKKRELLDKGEDIPKHGDGFLFFKNIVSYLEGLK